MHLWIFVWWRVWIRKNIKIRSTIIFVVILRVSLIVWHRLSHLERWALHASIVTIDLGMSWDGIELVTVLAWVERQRVHVWPQTLVNWASKESCGGIAWDSWICTRVELLDLRLRQPTLLIFLLWRCNPESIPDFLLLSCLVEFFQAISAHSHSLVVSKFWHFDEILWALRTDYSTAFTTMMLPFEESELEFANEACSSRIISCPVRPLSDLEVFNPSLVSLRT